jgi:hypothetical protein
VPEEVSHVNVSVTEVLLVAGWVVVSVVIGFVVWRLTARGGGSSGGSALSGFASGVLALIAGAVVIVLAGVISGS